MPLIELLLKIQGIQRALVNWVFMSLMFSVVLSLTVSKWYWLFVVFCFFNWLVALRNSGLITIELNKQLKENPK